MEEKREATNYKCHIVSLWCVGLNGEWSEWRKIILGRRNFYNPAGTHNEGKSGQLLDRDWG